MKKEAFTFTEIMVSENNYTPAMLLEDYHHYVKKDFRTWKLIAENDNSWYRKLDKMSSDTERTKYFEELVIDYKLSAKAKLGLYETFYYRLLSRKTSAELTQYFVELDQKRAPLVAKYLESAMKKVSKVTT